MYSPDDSITPERILQCERAHLERIEDDRQQLDESVSPGGPNARDG